MPFSAGSHPDRLRYAMNGIRFKQCGNEGLSLALLVFRILTNDADAAFSLNDFAFVADRLY